MKNNFNFIKLCIFLFLALNLVLSKESMESSILNSKDVQNLWKDLFSGTRGESCKEFQLRKQAIAQDIGEKKQQKSFMKDGNIKNKYENNNKFEWIKSWGYGQSSYLFDYIDPIFQKEISEYFSKIFENVMKEDGKVDDKHNDPFINIQKSKKIHMSIYQNSANAIQTSKIMKKWNWHPVSESDLINMDSSEEFILNYDLNYDGRLNPREFILGAIMYNLTNNFASCNFCFKEILKKLEAIFIYIDCNSDGFVTAKDLFENLKQLKRNTNKYNLFALSNKMNLRTGAVNDFILKNGNDAKITKEDFQKGILLGYWDRQTSNKSILLDDSRNLKHLRWSDNGMLDTNAFNYLKENIVK